MKDMLKPLKTESLTEVFINRFEELIISGYFPIGSKLPSERELSQLLGVSRPVVHEGLVDLSVKGLVTMKPRVGTVVNDYRRDGSLSLLNSLLRYHKGVLEPNILESMLRMRQLFETETVRLAALNRTDAQMDEISNILLEEKEAEVSDPDSAAERDFRFHHSIAIASGNVIYPLMIKSFKEIYTNLSGQFFSNISMVKEVFTFHEKLVAAIKDQNSSQAVSIMKALLEHGEKYLEKSIPE